MKKQDKNINKYKVVYAGQGGGFKLHDVISIPKHVKKMNDISSYVNSHANLFTVDIGIITHTEDTITFGTKMDGVIFDTPVLIIKLMNSERGKR